MSLSDYFRSQSDWRAQKAEQYPDDARNAQSAAALYSLAEYVGPDERGDHEADAVSALLPHLFDFALGGEEAQRAVSRYGFGYAATTPMQHIELIEELNVLCPMDAYEVAREHGEDPTGTLIEEEVAAAREGVHLPRYYFERRVRSTEAELKQAIEGYRGSEAESAVPAWRGLIRDEGPALDYESALEAILSLVGQRVEVTVLSVEPLGVVAEFAGELAGGEDVRHPDRATEGEAFRFRIGAHGGSFSVETRTFREAGWVRAGSATGSLRLYLGATVVELSPEEG